MLLRVDPIHYTAIQITIPKRGERKGEELEMNEHFVKELEAQGYVAAGPLEFHLYLNGVA